MFEKNDKALLTTRIIVMVFSGIIAVASLIFGIVLAVNIDGVYFLFAFVGWFICWIIWVSARLYMSYLVDVKLVRNKLYGESNEGLEAFLKSASQATKAVQPKPELVKLQQRYQAGEISKEDYDRLKRLYL